MSNPARSRGHDGPDERATVLVVEDEMLICLEIAHFLRSRGFRVVEAGNAEEAIQIFLASTPVHVVFTDVHMPGNLNGLGLARWVRREQPGVKVILTSGVTKAAALRDMDNDGLLMEKPYDPNEVERRIRQLLAE